MIIIYLLLPWALEARLLRADGNKQVPGVVQANVVEEHSSSSSGGFSHQDSTEGATVWRSRQTSSQPGCTPKCTWTCATSSCDQVCKPSCDAPNCETRCTGMSTAGCKMKCGKPRCTMVCQPGPCAEKDCPVCKSQCNKPQCSLVCPSGTQNCHDICEHPRCNWDCKKPALCPKPACVLQCDTPHACSGAEDTYKAIPPLRPDETIVANFQTPMSLLIKMKSNATKLTMEVPVTRATAVPGSKELKLVHSSETLPVVSAL